MEKKQNEKGKAELNMSLGNNIGRLIYEYAADSDTVMTMTKLLTTRDLHKIKERITAEIYERGIKENLPVSQSLLDKALAESKVVDLGAGPYMCTCGCGDVSKIPTLKQLLSVFIDTRPRFYYMRKSMGGRCKGRVGQKYQLKVIEAVNHKLPQAVDDSTDIDTFDFSSTKVTIEFPTKPERAMNFFVEGVEWRSMNLVNHAELTIENESILFTDKCGKNTGMAEKVSEVITPKCYLKTMLRSKKLAEIGQQITESSEFIHELFLVLQSAGVIIEGDTFHQSLYDNTFFKTVGEFHPSPAAER